MHKTRYPGLQRKPIVLKRSPTHRPLGGQMGSQVKDAGPPLWSVGQPGCLCTLVSPQVSCVLLGSLTQGSLGEGAALPSLLH